MTKKALIITLYYFTIQRIMSSISESGADQTARINKNLLELQKKGFLIHIH